MVQRKFDAVLFDFDGVLVDSEPVHFSCWTAILAPFGVTLDWDTYNRVGRGFSEADMVRAFCALANPPLAFEKLWNEYPRKKRMFVERALGLVTEDVRELVTELSGTAGMSLAVVTSSSRPEVEPILQAGGVLGLLGAFITAEDVTNPKPSPEPYQTAARRLGAVSRLVVEDTDVGEASGRAAGFEVLRVREAREVPERVRGWLRQ
jgi:beta-phosphoglucomutase-like phosphatase (HAD superfamily)